MSSFLARIFYIVYNEEKFKEECFMKQTTKTALLAGVAGYLIGFYEMKYKTIKAIAKGYAEKSEKESSENNEEQEES